MLQRDSNVETGEESRVGALQAPEVVELLRWFLIDVAEPCVGRGSYIRKHAAKSERAAELCHATHPRGMLAGEEERGGVKLVEWWIW